MFFKDFLNYINLLLLPDSACQKHITLKKNKRGTIKYQYQGCWDYEAIATLLSSCWRRNLKNYFGKLGEPTTATIGLAYAPATWLLNRPKHKWTRVCTRKHAGMFRAVLFIIAKKWKGSKCPSTWEWLNMLWYLHTMDYNTILFWYFFSKEVLIHAVALLNLAWDWVKRSQITSW